MILTLRAIWLRLLLPLLLFEPHVPIMHHRSSQLVDGHLLFSGETQNIEGLLFSYNGAKSDVKQLERQNELSVI